MDDARESPGDDLFDTAVVVEPEQMRAGSRALSIFTYTLNAGVLRAHADGPLRSCELEDAIGWAPSSSLRAAVSNLCERDALTKIELGDACATELTRAGRKLLPVANALELWLRRAPGGPVALDHPAANGIVRVLTSGWDSAVVRTIAERPLSLAELSACLPRLSYPSLKRRLAKLRKIGLVTPVGNGRVAAYEPGRWLRQAIAPLAIASRWELRNTDIAEPITKTEVEASFMLVLPLITFPAHVGGTCTLAVMTGDGEGEAGVDVTGVRVEVRNGEIVSFAYDSTTKPATWALGSGQDWLEATIDGNCLPLRLGGAKPELAAGLAEGIHDALFLA